MSGSAFEFRSDLSATPLAQVLETVHRYRVPGVIIVRGQQTEKRIFIWHGDVIFATSSDMQDSLGRYLVRTGVMTEAQFTDASRRLLQRGGEKRLGDILVEMGVLGAGRLQEIVQEQVRAIVTGLFEREDGEVTFQVGEYRTDELIKLKIPTRHMILQGVKAIRDARPLVSLLGPSWTVFSPAWAPAEIGDIGLSPSEASYLGAIDGVKTLRDLIAQGPADAAFNAKLVYAFFVLRLVVRRDADSGKIKKLQWKSPASGYHSGG